MKLSALVIPFTVSVSGSVRTRRDVGQRSYELLIDQMNTFNERFDEQMHFNYGCHCEINGKTFSYDSQSMTHKL